MVRFIKLVHSRYDLFFTDFLSFSSTNRQKMIYCENNGLQHLAIHYVGNKLQQDGVLFSHQAIDLTEDIKQLLVPYFISSFKSDEYYNLFHESDISLNEVYNYASSIFDNPEELFEKSISFAKHLYEQSAHPKIKGGEFYVAFFKDCIINGETIDTLGIFKTENKDTFFQVSSADNNFKIASYQGINISKLDKGCLIFNKDKEEGYIVAIVDNTSKGNDAQYWVDDFLHVRQRQDGYHNTQNALSLCKNFVVKELPQQFDVSKADQADILNRSVKFFKERDTFDMNEFANEVIGQPEVIDSFNNYKEEYQRDRDIEIADNFAISDSAVKKQSRGLKSVIKLDKNFHIYVHGNNQYIKKGYDEETGLHYYQLFFKEEQ